VNLDIPITPEVRAEGSSTYNDGTIDARLRALLAMDPTPEVEAETAFLLRLREKRRERG
jgi:hypothetical protein